jgi:hypothetical protein
MGKLDISGLKDSFPQPNANPRAAALLFIAVAAFAVAIAVFSFFSPPLPAANEVRLDIFLENGPSVPEGTAVKLATVSSCGPFGIYVDGAEHGRYDQSAKTSLSLAAGQHLFEAKNANCSASVSFRVEKTECGEGDSQACVVGKCNGTRTCYGGRWGGCIQPKKVCPPGQRMGCSVDGCNFGYAFCNECGSGFGPCLPANASGESCTGNGCG